MSRLSSFTLALIAALTLSSGADARTHPGARAAATAPSNMDMRKQCYEEARSHWGTNSQDMQTPREFLDRACMYDHGMHNP